MRIESESVMMCLYVVVVVVVLCIALIQKKKSSNKYCEKEGENTKGTELQKRSSQ